MLPYFAAKVNRRGGGNTLKNFTGVVYYIRNTRQENEALSNNAPQQQKETFGAVLHRYRVVLVLFVVLFAASLCLSVLLTGYNRSRLELGEGAPLADIGETPSQLLKPEEEPEVTGTVLTETTPVTDAYFQEKVLFIGDSLTTGLLIYDQVFVGYNVVAAKGINPGSAMTDAFYKIGDQTVTMVDAVSLLKPEIVYVMLGSNGINSYSSEWMLEQYEKLIDELIARVPGCAIVIQSIPPVTEGAQARNPEFYSLENITGFNNGLKEMALRKGTYFLDVYSALADETGHMPLTIVTEDGSEVGFAAADGVHMLPPGYAVWRDYLLTHTIQGEVAFSISADGYLAAVA